MSRGLAPASSSEQGTLLGELPITLTKVPDPENLEAVGAFEVALNEFLKNRNNCGRQRGLLRRPLVLGKQPIRLGLLYAHVVRRGGHGYVVRNKLWPTVAEDMRLHGSTTDEMKNRLAHLYQKYLLPLEESVFGAAVAQANESAAAGNGGGQAGVGGDADLASILDNLDEVYDKAPSYDGRELLTLSLGVEGVAKIADELLPRVPPTSRGVRSPRMPRSAGAAGPFKGGAVRAGSWGDAAAAGAVAAAALAGGSAGAMQQQQQQAGHAGWNGSEQAAGKRPHGHWDDGLDTAAAAYGPPLGGDGYPVPGSSRKRIRHGSLIEGEHAAPPSYVAPAGAIGYGPDAGSLPGGVGGGGGVVIPELSTLHEPELEGGGAAAGGDDADLMQGDEQMSMAAHGAPLGMPQQHPPFPSEGPMQDWQRQQQQHNLHLHQHPQMCPPQRRQQQGPPRNGRSLPYLQGDMHAYHTNPEQQQHHSGFAMPPPVMAHGGAMPPPPPPMFQSAMPPPPVRHPLGPPPAYPHRQGSSSGDGYGGGGGGGGKAARNGSGGSGKGRVSADDPLLHAQVDEVVPFAPAMQALSSPQVECICKLVTYQGGVKKIGLLVNKTGLYGFQPGETLRAQYTDGGKGIILSGSNDSARYVLFQHKSLPGVSVMLETVLNGGTRGVVRTPLPDSTWQALVDCGDVLADDEVLDDAVAMRRAYTTSFSGCMLLMFEVRTDASELEIDDL